MTRTSERRGMIASMESKEETTVSKLNPSKRRQQRQCLVECLYMWDMQPEIPIEDLLRTYQAEECERVLPVILQADFILQALRGVVAHKDWIDDKIRLYAKNWDFDRIAKVDLAILRLAIYELIFHDTPIPVAINEAIELSKRYSSQESKRFINGILDHIAKEG